MNEITNSNIQLDVTHISIENLEKYGRFCWGEKGAWIYTEWDRHNKRYFDSKLNPIGIIWQDTTKHGKCLGYIRQGKQRVIGLSMSIIEPKSEAPWGIDRENLNKKYASDVLLHEMIHHQNLDLIHMKH